MFNHKKTFKKISGYPDLWSLGQGMKDDKPIFVRIRNGFNEAVGHPDYPIQIGVAIPLLRPTENGLPEDEEAKQLDRLEQLLQLKIEKENGVFVMAITTNGMREFVFYVKEWKPEYFEKEIKSLDAGQHELQFMMQKDPAWDTFKRFMKIDNL